MTENIDRSLVEVANSSADHLLATANLLASESLSPFQEHCNQSPE